MSTPVPQWRCDQDDESAAARSYPEDWSWYRGTPWRFTPCTLTASRGTKLGPAGKQPPIILGLELEPDLSGPILNFQQAGTLQLEFKAHRTGGRGRRARPAGPEIGRSTSAGMPCRERRAPDPTGSGRLSLRCRCTAACSACSGAPRPAADQRRPSRRPPSRPWPCAPESAARGDSEPVLAGREGGHLLTALPQGEHCGCGVPCAQSLPLPERDSAGGAPVRLGEEHAQSGAPLVEQQPLPAQQTRVDGAMLLREQFVMTELPKRPAASLTETSASAVLAVYQYKSLSISP